jgi:hypothetical protein
MRQRLHFRNALAFALCLGLLLLIAPAHVKAQSGLGTITGQVTDATSAVIPGAAIRLTNISTNVEIPATSTSNGIFNITALIPGDYRLTVTHTGFQASEVAHIAVTAENTVTANVQLRVGQSSTRVEVEAESSLLTTTDQVVSTTIDHDLVANLPYPERSSLSAVMLVAGVHGNAYTPSQVTSENPGVGLGFVDPGAEISIGGTPTGHSPILVDGSDVSQASYPRAGVNVSGDLIQETTVVTGTSPAQYGHTAGGAIIQATRSGGNEFHGGVTWRHSDPKLQAWPTGSPVPAAAHQNFFGLYVSGPVLVPKIYNGHNRTFFTVAYEPGRVSNVSFPSFTAETQIPTPEELQGNFNNAIGLLNTTILSQQGLAAAEAAPRVGGLYYKYPVNAQGFPYGTQYAATSQYVPIANNNVSVQLAHNPLAQFLVAHMPTPQNPGPYIRFIRPDGMWDNLGNNAYIIGAIKNTDNRYSARLDHVVSDRDRFFVRWTDTPLTSARAFGFPATSPLDAYPSDQSWAKNVALNEVHIFGSNPINELRLLFMRNRQVRAESGGALSQDWASTLGLTPAVAGKGFPGLSFGYGLNPGVSTSTTNSLSDVDQNFQVADDFAWTTGRHSIRMGVDFRRMQSNQYLYNGIYGGQYTFAPSSTNNGSSGGDGLASLMLGLVSSFSNTPVMVPAYYRWHYYAGFIQDAIKLTPNLTANVGIRYEIETPRMEKYDNQGTFIPNLTGALNGLPATGAFCFSEACGLAKSLWPTNYKGVEPRVGIAWTPLPKMTVRAGYGLLRVPLTGNQNVPSPNFSVASFSVGGLSGGVVPNYAVDIVSNPVGPLSSSLSALQGKGPFFTVQGVTVPFVEQNDFVPQTQQWSLAVQYQLTSNTVMQVSYQGLRGTHLFTDYSLPLNFPDIGNLQHLVTTGYNFATNAPNPYKIAQNGAVISETQLQLLNPYQNFFNQNLTWASTGYTRQGDSIYHALYLSGKHRYRGGLTTVVSFTWAKSIDDAGGDHNINNYGSGGFNAYQYVTNLGLERAVSTWDVPVKFTTGYFYELPLGAGKPLSTHNRVIDAIIGNWNTSGTFSAQSGQPFEPLLGGAGYWVSTTGVTVLPSGITLRPNVTPGAACINPGWSVSPFTQSYINASQFTVPGSFGHPAFGNAPRTMANCRSPHVIVLNGGLNRRIRLGKSEKRYLQIGVTAQNILNHPIYFVPTQSSAFDNVFNAFNTASITNPNVPAFTANARFGTLNPASSSGMSRVAQLNLRIFW